MKILIAFGCFLVAVTLNSGLAQAEDAKKPAVKQTYAELLGKVKVNPLSADDSDEVAEELVKQKCNRNGGPKAFDNAVQGLANLESSIVALINATEYNDESEVSKTNEEDDEDLYEIEYLCGSLLLLKEWAGAAVDAVKPCFDPEEREVVEILVNVSFSVLEYACENEGSNLLGFFETGGLECLESKTEAIRACLPDNSTSAESSESSESTEATTSSASSGAIPKLFDVPDFAGDLGECTELENIRKCFAVQLNECPQRTPSNFINSIFNIIKRETGCNSILKAHAEQASNDL